MSDEFTQQYIYKQVKSIQFSVFSPKLIKKMASAKVVTPELYDKEGYPVDGGLMDIRLGVIDPGLKCRTCGSKLKECIGHFGYIELARPVIQINFVTIILNLLRCTCKECGRVLIPKNKIDKNVADFKQVEGELGLEARRKAIQGSVSKLKTINKCPYCKARQQKISIDKPTTYLENEKKLSPIEVRTRLEKIPDDDLEVFGYNPKHMRPEWGVLTVLPIPPVTMRPSITLESGERSEDDLTHKLGDIVRINQRLFENINAGAPEIIIEDLWDLLQYHITTYFDNNVAQLPPARHRSGQPLKTISERIKSKEGRIRHNLAGKRTNFSSRTVISPDPMLDLNEVGIPKIIAMKLTIPERVTDWNKEYLKAFIETGPKKYPGANYIVRPDGKKKKITDETKEQLLEELQPGYIVERHLMNGDIAIFNRQPSLHRMSMMCHRVCVLPAKTFRLNPAVCVAPDTLVQLSSGIQRPIDELKNCWKESELSTYNRKDGRLFSTELKKFWALKPEEYGAKCYEIITKETGRKIIATGDHPFYTSSGVKKAEKLSKNDKVIVRPLETAVYEEVDKIIVSEDDIKRIAPKETYLKHSIKVLEELKLLPLNLIDQRVMILARLLGHLFGDGTFILKRDTARIMFRGTKEDLRTIQEDIRSLGFNPEKIYVKTTGGIIHTVKGKKLNVVGSYPYFEVRNKPLALLFAAFGAPNGDKVKSGFSVPKWIKKAPKYIKREFIASYFGCELSGPKVRKISKSNFKTLVFKISKTKKNKKSGHDFIENLRELLKEFGVRLNKTREEKSNIRKTGEMTYSLVTSISDKKSITNFFGKIGYVYSSNRDNLARMAYQYSILKEKEIKKRKYLYEQFKNLRRKRHTFKIIARRLSLRIGTLENWKYRNKSAALPNDFISFNNWLQENAAGAGLVYETIDNIKETYCPFVYDITTTAPTHNFFANGFLTKNCTPYNADFDGDEMNIHIPQTEESRAEAEILMMVQTQLISPRYGLSIIGCTQDAISGNFLLTKDLILSREESIDLLSSVGMGDFSSLPRKEKISGKDIFSVLLPNDFNFIGRSKDGGNVIIKDGKLIEGHLDSSNLGEGSGLLLRNLHKKYGEEKAIDLLGKFFKLGIKTLLKVGFTTGIQDTDLPLDAKEKIENSLKSAEERVQDLIDIHRRGELETFPGKTAAETLELKILEVLNKTRNEVGGFVAQYTDKQSGTSIMASSGARGNPINLAQMAACVGQQAMRGRRIDKGYSGRTLSCFKRGDLSPAARGFIRGGFKGGLRPHEFFFMGITGRDSLMDTALRTPKSGYLYRRLANAMQDLKVEYDHSVRDASKKIIQFKYGGDMIDVSKSEAGTINVQKIIDTVK